MEVFDFLNIIYHNTTDQNLGSKEPILDTYWSTNMTEKKMMIETRPRYPSNKLTFTIANITKGTNIRFLDIILNLNAKFDVDLLLEDSKRICIFNIR